MINWRKPANEDLTSAHWVDPIDCQGMLSARHIIEYVEKTTMIEPFDAGNLKTSSYRLTLGRWVQINGIDKELTEADPILEIPPNAMAFASVGEILRLPHYIAARFNLAIEHIYNGLLLGTGPQVDPGFQGVLSCPLHNLSDNPVRIKLGDHLATIDFVKTSGLGTLPAYEQESQLYDHVEQLAREQHFFLFPKAKRWLRPILGYAPGRIKIESSLTGLQNRIGRIENLGLIAVAALVVGLLIAVPSIIPTFVQPQQALTHDVADLKVQLSQAQDKLTAEDAAQAQLKSCLAGIRAELSSKPGQPITTLPTSCP